jgi:hypothetical protein
VTALATGDPAVGAEAEERPRSVLERRNAATYEGAVEGPPGVVWLAESADRGWSASADERPLDRRAGGWGNAFALGDGADGRVRVFFEEPGSQVLMLLVLVLAWTVVVGAAASKAAPASGSRVP